MRTKLIVATLLCCVFGGFTFADDPIVLKSGGKYFFLRKDSAGVPITSPVPVVIDMDSNSPEAPNPTPETPTPSPQDPLKEAVRIRAASVGEPTFAKAMAVLWGEIGRRLQEGEIKKEDAVTGLSLGYKELLKRDEFNGTESKWNDVIKEINQQAAKLIQNGQLETQAQWVSFILSVSKGFNEATAGAAIEDIISIINLVMKLINLLFGDGKIGDTPNFGVIQDAPTQPVGVASKEELTGRMLIGALQVAAAIFTSVVRQ